MIPPRPRPPSPPDYTTLSYNKLYTISNQLGLITNLLRQMNNLKVLRQNMFLSQIAGEILAQVKQSNNKAENFYNAFVNYTKSNGNQPTKLIF